MVIYLACNRELRRISSAYPGTSGANFQVLHSSGICQHFPPMCVEVNLIVNTVTFTDVFVFRRCYGFEIRCS